MKLLSLTIAAIMAGTAIAGSRGLRGNSDQLGLIQKTRDDDGVYSIPVENGAWGKLRYRTSGLLFDFTFAGHGLVPDTPYTLVMYIEETNKIKCLSSSKEIANNGGNVNIIGDSDTGSFEERKIWLGPTESFDCARGYIIKPNFDYFLFEENLISYEETDEP